MKNQLWAVSEEACCPFKHHSRPSLRQLLQPSSGVVLQKICCLVDAEDYSGACRLHLASLTLESESHDGDYNHACLSDTVVNSSVSGPQHTADKQNDVEEEQTMDSGYDSAQSYQPVLNSSTSASSSQSSESFEALNITKSHAHQQNSSAVVLPSEPDDCGSCNVQEHIVCSDCDIMAKKLHAPVDFYTSFNCLVAGLYCHAAS